MFRQVGRLQLARLHQPALLQPQLIRQFHFTPCVFKKHKKDAAPLDPELPSIDFTKVSENLQKVVDQFTKHASEAKAGKTNPQIFNNLKVKTPEGIVPYTSVALTSVKGRNFMLTIFDPANVKEIVNAILGSGLNMNPVADPANKQMLKVPLPPLTTEVKKESIKQLKIVHEKLKHGPGGRNAHTLSAIRSEVKNQISKKKKMTDAEQDLWLEYETLHKKYVEKLNAAFKAAETAILK